jgi:type IV pilus assembly protein PilM
MASDLSVLGLDIGSRYIKFIELHKSGKKIEVARKLLAETPRESEEISGFISQFLREHQISVHTAVLGIPKSQMAFKYLQLSTLDPEQIHKALESEVRKLLPFPPKDITFSYHLQKRFLNKKAHILMVALRKDLLEQGASVLREGEFETRIVELSPLAQVNSYLYNYNPSFRESVALLDMGATTTTITILKEEFIRFSRDIPIGGDAIIAAIKDKLDLGWDKAAAVKINTGITLEPGEEDETAREVSYALEPILDQLIIEAERSFKISYYVDHTDLITPHAVFLTGGGGRLKNLDKYLEKRLNIPVTKLNPFNKIEGQQGLEEDYPIWSIAVGLGLRGLEEFPITFNLMPG